VIIGRATPGIIAIVGQAPALASVALITQYNIFFWFIAGLGVAALAKANQEEKAARVQGERELLPSGPAVPFPGVIPGL
jgi:hypothetical protein